MRLILKSLGWTLGIKTWGEKKRAYATRRTCREVREVHYLAPLDDLEKVLASIAQLPKTRYQFRVEGIH